MLNMHFVDTHCHIHEAQYDETADVSVRQKWIDAGKPDPDDILMRASQSGVKEVICVGTTLADSMLALGFAGARENVWASIGIHPHEAASHIDDHEKMQQFRDLGQTKSAPVAIGECGLDYFYEHSPRNKQIPLLEAQLQLAQDRNLPVIFHVRDAFDDFWPILNNFPGIKGVLHSFTDTVHNLDVAVSKGLYIGLNGIMTFSRNPDHPVMVAALPSEYLVLETDAPFLTPTPERGKICEPRHVVLTAEYVAKIRNISVEELAEQTSRNAHTLFQLNK